MKRKKSICSRWYWKNDSGLESNIFNEEILMKKGITSVCDESWNILNNNDEDNTLFYVIRRSSRDIDDSDEDNL